jgi:hypothetical protein
MFFPITRSTAHRSAVSLQSSHHNASTAINGRPGPPATLNLLQVKVPRGECLTHHSNHRSDGADGQKPSCYRSPPPG